MIETENHCFSNCVMVPLMYTIDKFKFKIPFDEVFKYWSNGGLLSNNPDNEKKKIIYKKLKQWENKIMIIRTVNRRRT